MLDIKKLLAKILNAPFVIEEGTSGIWTYRKWSDGTAECWGIVSKTGHNINRAWGGWYVSASGAANEFYANYPTDLFIDTPTEVVSLGGTHSATPLLSGTGQSSKTITNRYVCARGTSATNVALRMSFFAVGRWK